VLIEEFHSRRSELNIYKILRTIIFSPIDPFPATSSNQLAIRRNLPEALISSEN
jgi:hypothetical protein